MRALICTAMTAALASSSAAVAQDAAKASAGERVYNNYCFTCHGDNLVSSGQTFDLRRLKPEDRARYENAVLNGKGQMPPWKGVLSDQDIDNVWHYIRANATAK